MQTPQVSMRYARIAGAFYLPVFVLGPFAVMFVRASLVVPDDAATTAQQVRADSWLFRVGTVTELVLALIDIVLSLVLYVVFRPVSRNGAMVAAFFRLTWAGMAATAVFTNLLVLLLLSDAEYLAVFNAEQVNALALLFLNLHEYMFAVGLVVFGLHIGILGYLISKSGIVPRAIGMLLSVAAIGYLISSLILILMLDVPTALRTAFLLPAFVGELSLCLWLLIKGVRPVASLESGVHAVAGTGDAR